ncbi:glycine cleavage system T protein [Desulfitobacterium hafniense DCB-2]|uniref:Aminomethyltransferase n=2 Tax=Desulfitobacterium hafniense TaxID=49338 RepID=GCST_DESHD|nr:glycine cleavage system aminomethyltransferase GcvT [Desulfitobacterium hafniense]B8FT33.1 RecName: Full=Aminomethyltransferase; AltName: Full=Glycine cleavage system T protein [Desulfitobacterium hafniense DCB-2]ACL22049.1 glycine cleavage system T protein [Desulfitobacterium hafniense DCB-2]EHL07364.1 aminomethyltransferase [Desulfitobacterium hafniense DP7]
MTELKRTPLYEQHRRAGAKLIDFGGWEMPVQYAGVIEEHKAVRSKAGLFDVSHMGEVELKGKDSLAFLQYLLTNDVSRIQDNQIQYSPMCTSAGGVVDDLLVYRYSREHFLLVVNASNTDKDFAWMQAQAEGFEISLENRSGDFAQLALQGPWAEKILQKLTSMDLAQINYYWFKHGEVDGVLCLISRTGYTGEDGFEIYLPPEHAPRMWERILEVGGSEGVQPIGLGARDTLRFEARLPLYGNELGPDITPLEAGLGFFVKLEKDNFIGKEALSAQKEKGVPRKLVGLEMIERGIARSHYPLQKEGKEIGFITSGSFSPTLNKNIALGLIPPEYAQIGETLDVIIRGKAVKARIIPSLFYKRQG